MSGTVNAMTDGIHRMKEQLLERYADIMLLALRKEAGVLLTTDEYYKAKEKVMDAIKGMTTL